MEARRYAIRAQTRSAALRCLTFDTLKVCSQSFFIQKHGMRFAGSRKKCGFAWAGDSSGCNWESRLVCRTPDRCRQWLRGSRNSA
jgi:hypothetical protein